MSNNYFLKPNNFHIEEEYDFGKYFLNLNKNRSNLHIISSISGQFNNDDISLSIAYGYKNILPSMDDNLSLSCFYKIKKDNQKFTLYDYLGNDYEYVSLGSDTNSIDIYFSTDNSSKLEHHKTSNEIIIYFINQTKICFEYTNATNNQIVCPKYIEDIDKNRVSYSNFISDSDTTYYLTSNKNETIRIKKSSGNFEYIIEVINGIINVTTRKYTIQKNSSTYSFKEEILKPDHESFSINNQYSINHGTQIIVNSIKDQTILTFSKNTNNEFTNISNSFSLINNTISYNEVTNTTSVSTNTNGVNKTFYYGFDDNNNPLYIVDHHGYLKTTIFDKQNLKKSFPLISLNNTIKNYLINGNFNMSLTYWQTEGNVSSPTDMDNTKIPTSISRCITLSPSSLISQTIEINNQFNTYFHLYFNAFQNGGIKLEATIKFYNGDDEVYEHKKIITNSSTSERYFPYNEMFTSNKYSFTKIKLIIKNISSNKSVKIGNIFLHKSSDYIENKVNENLGVIYQTFTPTKRISDISYDTKDKISVNTYRNNKKYSIYSNLDDQKSVRSNDVSNTVGMSRDSNLNIVSKTIKKTFKDTYLLVKDTYINNLLKSVEDENKITHDYFYDPYHLYLQKDKIYENINDYYEVIYNLNEYFNPTSISNNGENVNLIYDYNNSYQKLDKLETSDLKYDFNYANNNLLSLAFFVAPDNSLNLLESYVYLSTTTKSDVVVTKAYGGDGIIDFTYDSYYEKVTSIKINGSNSYQFTYQNDLLSTEVNNTSSSVITYSYTYNKNLLISEGDGTYLISYSYDGLDNLEYIKETISTFKYLSNYFSSDLDYSYSSSYLNSLIENSDEGIVNKFDSIESKFIGNFHGVKFESILTNVPNCDIYTENNIKCISPSPSTTLPTHRIFSYQYSSQEICCLVKPTSLSNGVIFCLEIIEGSSKNQLYLKLTSSNTLVLCFSYDINTVRFSSNAILSNLKLNSWNILRFRYNFLDNHFSVKVNDQANYYSFTIDNLGISVANLSDVLLTVGSFSDNAHQSNQFIGKIALPFISSPDTYFSNSFNGIYTKYIASKKSSNTYFSNEIYDKANTMTYYQGSKELINYYPLNGSFKSLDNNVFDEVKTISKINDFAFSEDINSFMFELGPNKYLKKKNVLHTERGIISCMFKPLNNNFNSDLSVLFTISNGSTSYYFLVDNNNKLYFNTSLSMLNATYSNLTLDNNHVKRLTISYVRTGSTSLTIYIKYGSDSLSFNCNTVNFATSSLDLYIGSLTSSYSFNSLISGLTFADSYNNIDSFISPFDKDISSSFIIDKFSRGVKQAITNNNSPLITKTLSYKEIPLEGDVQIIGVTRTSNVLQNETINVGSTSFSYDYTFDYLGRVTSISSNGNTLSRYEYNSKGFISRKWDGDLISDIYSYSYDSKGNITNISKGLDRYEMTYDSYNRISSYIKNNVIGTISKNLSFTYSTGTYKYLLTSITNNITNSSISLSYLGKRLVSYIDNNVANPLNISYVYNSNGERISKTVNNVTTNYYYTNGLLTHSYTGNNHIHYLYDSNNQAFGFIYNNDRYFYIRDILGNINKITNDNGEVLVTYSYTDFGQIQNIVDTSNIELSKINQILYKGYVYDVETELYWVSSRYYSPELCRWITPDSIEHLDPQSINGLNLYAYCGNDPINKYDPTGHFPWLVLAAFVFVGITRAAANAIGQYQSTGQIDWFEVAVEGVYGGVMGALTVATAGTFSIANLIIRTGVTAVATGLKDGLLVYNDTGDIEKAGMAGLKGAIKGGLISFALYVAFSPTNVTQWTFVLGALSGIGSGYLSGLKDKDQKIRWPWMWSAISY